MNRTAQIRWDYDRGEMQVRFEDEERWRKASPAMVEAIGKIPMRVWTPSVLLHVDGRGRVVKVVGRDSGHMGDREQAGWQIVPVGLAEIAQRLGVARSTVDQWRARGLLPPQRWVVGGRPAWDWDADIEPWARSTGRLA